MSPENSCRHLFRVLQAVFPFFWKMAKPRGGILIQDACLFQAVFMLFSRSKSAARFFLLKKAAEKA